MKKEIFYVGHFCPPNIIEAESRYNSPAANTKMNYISNVLVDIGYKVNFFSLCETTGIKNYKRKCIKLDKNRRVTFISTFGRKNIIFLIFRKLSMYFQLIFFLFSLKKEDVIIVYHSLISAKIVYLCKIFKAFKLILEVEEIYSDVNNSSHKKKAKELKYLKNADAYIFPTEQLNQMVNKNNKEYCVVHGTYQVNFQNEQKFNDNKIHIIYAGILDPRKGGEMAVNIAKYLNCLYHLHILGYGSDDQIKNIKKKINDISNESNCIISYDGFKSGEDYLNFISMCQIGLCTQNISENYNMTSFPSKILSYLSNGLRVVSAEIDVIKKSKVGDMLIYYHNECPKNIAQAIMKIDFSKDYDSKKRIKDLDVETKQELKEMLSKYD